MCFFFGGRFGLERSECNSPVDCCHPAARHRMLLNVIESYIVHARSAFAEVEGLGPSDCRKNMSLRTSPQTGVAPSRDSLRSQSPGSSENFDRTRRGQCPHWPMNCKPTLVFQISKAAPHNLTRRLSQDFYPSSKFGKWRNTVCISHFSN